MTASLHHVGVTTSDLDRLAAFYVAAFDAKVIRQSGWGKEDGAFNAAVGLREQGARIALLQIGSAFLELFEFEAAPEGARPLSIHTPGPTHIGFLVEDIQTAYKRLTDMSVPFHTAPFQGPAGGWFAYGKDSDGNIIELMQPPG